VEVKGVRPGGAHGTSESAEVHATADVDVESVLHLMG